MGQQQISSIVYTIPIENIVTHVFRGETYVMDRPIAMNFGYIDLNAFC